MLYLTFRNLISGRHRKSRTVWEHYSGSHSTVVITVIKKKATLNKHCHNISPQVKPIPFQKHFLESKRLHVHAHVFWHLLFSSFPSCFPHQHLFFVYSILCVPSVRSLSSVIGIMRGRGWLTVRLIITR